MERTMSSEEYQALGRTYYKRQQYGKAVAAFTEAIEAKVRPTVDQYDQRAASFEKLKNYNAALKDGREMIKVDKQDIKGYLRTGSILQKVNKPEKAIGIYKYGMEHVPVHNRNFKVQSCPCLTYITANIP
jgi:F-box/TPR repeat protein Pof3